MRTVRYLVFALSWAALSASAGDLDLQTTKGGVVVVTPKKEFRGNHVPNPEFKQKLQHWQTQFPEKNETKYNGNHRLVSVVDAPAGRAGKAIELNSIPKVAGSQGVKAVTPLIRIREDQAYEFGADVLSLAPAVKIFIEGYKEEAERTEAGNDRYPGFVRCYRAAIHVKVPKRKWGAASRIIKPPKRYQPTHVLIKLYCYWPTGKVYFTNVFLRPTDQEPTKTYGPIRKPRKKRAKPDNEAQNDNDAG